MYVATGGPNVKWRGTDFKWGGRAPLAPLLATTLRRVHPQERSSDGNASENTSLVLGNYTEMSFGLGVGEWKRPREQTAAFHYVVCRLLYTFNFNVASSLT